MSEQVKNPNPRPKKKRRPRWQRILIHYWPLIRLCLLALLCLTLIIMAIVALVKGASKDKQKPDEDPSSLAETVQPEDVEADAAAEAEKAAQTAISEANILAAGYDYAAAIDHLKKVAGWSDSEVLTAKIAEYEAADAALVPYEAMSTITHIYFQSLIVDTDRAFDNDEKTNNYNMYYTPVE